MRQFLLNADGAGHLIRSAVNCCIPRVHKNEEKEEVYRKNVKPNGIIIEEYNEELVEAKCDSEINHNLDNQKSEDLSAEDNKNDGAVYSDIQNVPTPKPEVQISTGDTMAVTDEVIAVEEETEKPLTLLELSRTYEEEKVLEGGTLEGENVLEETKPKEYLQNTVVSEMVQDIDFALKENGTILTSEQRIDEHKEDLYGQEKLNGNEGETSGSQKAQNVNDENGKTDENENQALNNDEMPGIKIQETFDSDRIQGKEHTGTEIHSEIFNNSKDFDDEWCVLSRESVGSAGLHSIDEDTQDTIDDFDELPEDIFDQDGNVNQPRVSLSVSVSREKKTISGSLYEVVGLSKGKIGDPTKVSLHLRVLPTRRQIHKTRWVNVKEDKAVIMEDFKKSLDTIPTVKEKYLRVRVYGDKDKQCLGSCYVDIDEMQKQQGNQQFWKNLIKTAAYQDI